MGTGKVAAKQCHCNSKMYEKEQTKLELNKL
jgi:hypothetical protein